MLESILFYRLRSFNLEKFINGRFANEKNASSGESTAVTNCKFQLFVRVRIEVD